MRGSRSFTFTEILLVIAIMLLLGAAGYVALNPPRRLAQARNVRRQTEAKSIADAVLNYRLDEDDFPAGIDNTWRMIGTAAGGCQMICGVGGEEQTETDLPPSADSYLREDTSDVNYGSATAIHIYPWEPSWTRRGIVRFSLSGIPAGVIMEEATMYLHESGTFGSTRTLGVYRVTQSWTEGGVTWNKRSGSDAWGTPGGDFNGSPTDTETISWTGTLKWDSWDVTSDVQKFVNGELNNYGWVVKDTNEDSSQSYWFFYSKEGATAPYLKVKYSASKTADACLNLSSALAKYLPSMPADPKGGSGAKTYYAVRKGPQGQIQVAACTSELGEEIIVEQ